MQIEIFDQALTRAENNNLVTWCRQRPWRWQNLGQLGQRHSGVISDLEDCEDRTVLVERAQSLCTKLQGLELNQCYVNMYQPGEEPDWHRDGAVWTVLFYITLDTEPRLGGATEFLDYARLETRGILPQPGRMIVFNGDLLHRARAYPHQERMTIALKFNRSDVQKGRPNP